MSDTLFTRDNLDSCLKELAKEFRKINGSNFCRDYFDRWGFGADQLWLQRDDL